MFKNFVPVLAATLSILSISVFAQNASACDRLTTSAEAYSFASLAILRGGGLTFPGPGQVNGGKSANEISTEMCADLVSSSTAVASGGVTRVTFVFSGETCKQDLILATDGRVARDVTPVTCAAR